MNSFWIVLFPLLIFYFQWMHNQKRHGAYCPHCGGNLGSDFGIVGQRHKVPDDELGGRGSGFSIQDLPNLTLIIALAFFLVAYVVLSLTPRNSPVVTLPRQPEPIVAPPMPIPTPASNPADG